MNSALERFPTLCEWLPLGPLAWSFRAEWAMSAVALLKCRPVPDWLEGRAATSAVLAQSQASRDGAFIVSDWMSVLGGKVGLLGWLVRDQDVGMVMGERAYLESC